MHDATRSAVKHARAPAEGAERRRSSASSRSARRSSGRSSRSSAQRKQLLSSLNGQIAADDRRRSRRASSGRRRPRGPPTSSSSRPGSRSRLPRARSARRRRRPEGATVVPPSSYRGAAGVALSYIGTPYVWAGARPAASTAPASSCTRTRRWASRCRTRRTRSGTSATSVPRDQLQAGDIVFFDGLGPRGHLHRQRPVRARAAHRRRREGVEPGLRLVRLLVRRRPPRHVAQAARGGRSAVRRARIQGVPP